MKPFVYAALAVSVMINALLVHYALGGTAFLGESPAGAGASGVAAAPSHAAGGTAIDSKIWPTLQTDDLSSLVARLREAGFPKDMIRAIIGSLVDEQFAARRKALEPDAAKRPFWKNTSSDPKFQRALYLLSREQQKAVEALLGENAGASDDPMTLARQRAQFGDLSPEKMAAVQRVLHDFDDKRSEFYATNVTMGQADYQKFQADQRAALAQVLTPAELEEYDLRNSNTGQSLRDSLAAFNPTEAEFREIFKLKQPFDEQYQTYNGLPSQSQQQQRMAAEKQLNDQIAAALGPERAAEYQRDSNYDYLRTSQLVTRLELPPETTLNLWNIQQDIQKQRDSIYQTARDPEQRTQQLTALQQTALAQVASAFGSAQGVEAYKQYGGNWLTYLVPTPRPAIRAAVTGK
jgi:hypothetical protein